jgi:hypothetical protein
MRPLLTLLLIINIGSFAVCQTQSLPDEIRLSYVANQQSCESILLELSEKTQVNIAFSNELIPDTLLNIRAVSQTLGQIIDDLISDFGLKYQIVGDQIVILKDPYAGLDENYTISGIVYDSLSGEKLIFANIFEHDQQIGVPSNHYGYYSLTIAPGEYILRYRYLGYNEKFHRISLVADTIIDVGLKPNTLLHEIVIRDKLPSDKIDLSDKIELPLDKMHSLTGLAGETDLLHTAQLLPGIVTGADGFGGLHIRGGSPDQNMILLDGAPIYNVGHALGVYSIFNPVIISKAQLIKGPFPARYGGRLSSILDVRTKEGNNRFWEGSGGISALAGRLTVEGPIAKEKSSIMLSFRRTLLDPWIKEFTNYQNEQNGNDGSANYYFYDFNGKLNFHLGERHHMFLSVYNGADKFETRLISADESGATSIEELSNDVWDWGNTMASFRWNMILGKKLFVNWTSNASRFQFQLFNYDRRAELLNGEQENLYYNASLYNSEIEDIASKLDLEVQFTPSYQLNTGLKYIRHQFSPGLLPVTRSDRLFSDDQLLGISDLQNLLDLPQITGNEMAIFVDNKFDLGSSFHADFGMHASAIQTTNETYLSLQPRLAIELWFGKSAIFTGSFAKMQQYLHLLSDSGFGLPSDVWLPSTDNLKPEESWQATAGLNFLPGNNWNIGFEGYYKQMDNIITYSDEGEIPIASSNDWESEIPVGEGTAYGIESGITRKAGRTTGWINYTLSWAKRKFSSINDGNEFFARYDRRHNLKIGMVFRINENSEFTFNWNYGTGNRVTLVDQIFRLNDSTLVVNYEDRNNGFLPKYHRLDLSFNLYNKYKWGQQKLSIGLYNAYNRKNPIYIDVDRNDADIQQFVTKSVSIFPVIPSISYNLSF